MDNEKLYLITRSKRPTFILWKTKGEILKIVLVALFHESRLWKRVTEIVKLFNELIFAIECSWKNLHTHTKKNDVG